MENASKALIIAGAILLSILLISLGIMIYTQAQSVVNGSGMDQAAVGTFNSKLQKYEGDIKGSMLKALINELVIVNSDDDLENNVDGTVSVGTKKVGSAATDIKGTSWVNINSTYNVSFSRDSKGRINKVTIK